MAGEKCARCSGTGFVVDEARSTAIQTFHVPCLACQPAPPTSGEPPQAEGPPWWCETCQSWRYTQPCGRDDCPKPSDPTAQSSPPSGEPPRCAVCGWPLTTEAALGCTRGNCSMRPLPAHPYDPERAIREYGQYAPEEWKQQIAPTPPAAPPVARDRDVLLSTLEAAKLLIRNGDSDDAVSEVDKAIRQVEGGSDAD